MAERSDYPFVGRTGYRVSGPIDPGMRSHLTRKPRVIPEQANGAPRSTGELRELASARAGFGR